MKVFVSSVRRGLESERDALRGMIAAIGHTPLAFEDFTSRSEPSRQACMEGVAAADVYVLLIGPFYGHRFEDTGQSPTHDEWVAAQQAGIPRLVFLKEGVDLDADQQEFYRSVSNYASGVFYNSFVDTADLLVKAAAAIREQAAAPSPLRYAPLPGSVAVSWRRDFHQGMNGFGVSSGAQLELHIVGVPASAHSDRQMGELASGLAGRIRAAHVVDDGQPVHVAREDGGAVVVTVPARQRSGFGEPVEAGLSGVRVAADGQVSVWGLNRPGESGDLLV